MRVFIVLLLVFYSCGTHEEPSVIPKEKMTQIMEEIFLIENHYQMTYGSPSIYKNALDSSCLNILNKHHVSKKAYEESFSYYANNPEELLEMQRQIIDDLNKKRVGF